MKKWLGFQFSTGCDTGMDYRKFERAAKKSLSQILTKSGAVLCTFNGSHYEFSAVATKDGKYAYISISDVRFFPDEWYHHVLVRTMKHEKDWRGGTNMYCSWEEIGQLVSQLTA